MNGADALIDTLVANGVTACFANPGTSEMQFVAALDRQPAMRPVLCLFEGVATGAADGYGRMSDAPACTLLHLGPGYGNGLANLHNARRAHTPIINVVGDHATYHRQYDAPLQSDIEAIVAPNSLWVRSADAADDVSRLTAEAISASQGPPGGPVSLILPADAAWNPASGPLAMSCPTAARAPSAGQVQSVVTALREAKNPVVFIGGRACRAEGLAAAARLAASGLRVITDTFVPRQPRGAGAFMPEKLAYFGEQALESLAGVDLMVLAGTQAPVAFFAYPGRPSLLVPDGCAVMTLAGRDEDSVAGLEGLADLLGAPPRGPVARRAERPGVPTGALTPAACGASIARHMPEGAIVCDDAVTSGAAIARATAEAAPHEALALTGGAIGAAGPMAVGAGVARPDAKVVALSGDGAAMYTIQSLWTLARENIDCTMVVFANNSYRILNIEMDRTGAGGAGPSASRLLNLGEPTIDWVSLARGQGVEAVRCETGEAFDLAFAAAMGRRGPMLIEAVIP